MNTVRWNIAVSQDTDLSLRQFLADHGGSTNEDQARFIEEAVHAHIFELTAEQVKTANVTISETEMADVVEEALLWARNH